MDSKVRVLIVEDFEPFLRFITAKLSSQSQLQIIAGVCDGEDAVQKARELQPDLILLDIGLPTLDGIEVARRIKKLSPRSKILFVSENRAADIAEEAQRAGGDGYVVKSDAATDLLPAIDAVLHAKRFVSASLGTPVLAVATLNLIQAWNLSWVFTFILGIR